MKLSSLHLIIKSILLLWIIACSSFTVVYTTKALPPSSPSYRTLRHASLAPVLVCAALHELYLWVLTNYQRWMVQLEASLRSLLRYLHDVIPIVQEQVMTFLRYARDHLLPYVQRQMLLALDAWGRLFRALVAHIDRLLEPFAVRLGQCIAQVYAYCVKVWPILKQAVLDGLVRCYDLTLQGIALYFEHVHPVLVRILEATGKFMRQCVDIAVLYLHRAMGLIATAVEYLQTVATGIVAQIEVLRVWICGKYAEVCLFLDERVHQLWEFGSRAVTLVAHYCGDALRAIWIWVQNVYAECRQTVRWFASVCWSYAVRAAYAVWRWLCAKANVVRQVWLEYVWVPVRAYVVELWHAAREELQQICERVYQHAHQQWTAYCLVFSSQMALFQVALAQLRQDAINACYEVQQTCWQQYADAKRDIAAYWSGGAKVNA